MKRSMAIVSTAFLVATGVAAQELCHSLNEKDPLTFDELVSVRMENSLSVICMYVEKSRTIPLSAPLRYVIGMQLENNDNEDYLTLAEGIILYHELERRIGKEWKVSPYYSPRVFLLDEQVTFSSENLPTVLNNLAQGVFNQPADYANVRFRINRRDGPNPDLTDD